MPAQTLCKSLKKDYHLYQAILDVIYNLLLWVPMILIGIYTSRYVYHKIITEQIDMDNFSNTIAIVPISLLIYLVPFCCILFFLEGRAQEKYCISFSDRLAQQCIDKKYKKDLTEYFKEIHNDIKQQAARKNDISEMSMEDALNISVNWRKKYAVYDIICGCGLFFEYDDKIYDARNEMDKIILANKQLRIYLITDELIRKGIDKKHIDAFTSTLGVYRARLRVKSAESLYQLGLTTNSDTTIPLRIDPWQNYISTNQTAIDDFCEQADILLSQIKSDNTLENSLEPFIEKALSIATA